MLKKGVSFLGLMVVLTVFTSFCASMASYPQIIHAESEAMRGGRITCEEFVDVNGVVHEHWIPAIRLGGG